MVAHHGVDIMTPNIQRGILMLNTIAERKSIGSPHITAEGMHLALAQMCNYSIDEYERTARLYYKGRHVGTAWLRCNNPQNQGFSGEMQVHYC